MVKRELLDDEGLEAIQEWAAQQEQTVNVDQVHGDFDEHLESTAGYAVRLMKQLRAVLAQEACTSCDGSGDCTDATGEWRGYCSCPAGVELKNRPAQEAGRQEPFAWFTDDYLTDKSSTTYDELTSNRWKDKGWPVQPLYISPPAPVAVTLTDEQILEVMRPVIYRADGGYVFDMAKDDVIEAGRALIDKLKEMNQ